MSLSDIVDVVITRQTQSVTEQGFGTPMILGTHNKFTDLIRFYSDMQGVSEDFSADDLEYIAAQDIFSQEIAPNRIGIGRRQVNEVDIFVVTPMPSKEYTLTINGVDYTFTTAATAGTLAEDVALGLKAEIELDVTAPVTVTTDGNGLITLTLNSPGDLWDLEVSSNIVNPSIAQIKVTQVYPGQEYFVEINGVEFSYVAPFDVQSANDIATPLVNLINQTPLAVQVAATNNFDGSFEVSAIIAETGFAFKVSPEKMSIEKGLIVQPMVASNLIAEDLTTINNVDNSWYALILTDRDPTTVISAADWIETRMKLFGTASSDPDIIDLAAGDDNTSIAGVLSLGTYKRTFVMYHQDADTDFPEAAWLGRVLPLEPGSETWKFKNLNGISYSKLTTTQSDNVLNKNANTYEFVAGVGITADGTVAVGEYIDIIRGIDWLTSRIQEFVFRVLVNNDKIAYTDSGIAVIQAEVMRVLSLGVGNNFLASDPPPVVTVPLAFDVPPVDKSNRILKNVKFSATLAGAIHFVQIRGILSI